jgi:hypothetical protein
MNQIDHGRAEAELADHGLGHHLQGLRRSKLKETALVSRVDQGRPDKLLSQQDLLHVDEH